MRIIGHYLKFLNLIGQFKTCQTILTRRNDRLPPLHFELEHNAATKKVFVDYLSENPLENPVNYQKMMKNSQYSKFN